MAMIPLRERGYSEVSPFADNSAIVALAWEKLAAAIMDVSSEKLKTQEIAVLIVEPDENPDFKFEVLQAANDIYIAATKCHAISIWTGSIYNEKLAELICHLPNFHGKHVPEKVRKILEDNGFLQK